MTRAPAIFVPHGGGPMPILNEPNHAELIQFLTTKARTWLGSPKAIILVSAHWETNIPSISSSDKHDLYYDYYNFPKEAYSLKYNAPGSQSIANEIHQVLSRHNISSQLDSKRGWDHGLFVPLILMVPNADIPIIQMSVLQNQNAKELLDYGAALSELRDQGIAIVGSGASFHSFSPKDVTVANRAFEAQLQKYSKLPLSERVKALTDWRSIEGSYECQPKGKSEHFSPYLVVTGAAQNSPLVDSVIVNIWGKQHGAFVWND
ncbi:hypothetical protein HDV02_005102 [Globomyces sp. JEL0801]|nr:hypothetical protein HDV02_005102 [Globomyces sp. JEL0801]